LWAFAVPMNAVVFMKFQHRFTCQSRRAKCLSAIGQDSGAPKKLFTIRNIEKPISHKPWSVHLNTVEEALQDVLANEFTGVAWESKVCQRSLEKASLKDMDDEQLKETIVDIGVSLDCLWSSRGLSAMDGIVAAIDVF